MSAHSASIRHRDRNGAGSTEPSGTSQSVSFVGDVERISLESIKPYGRNARRHSKKQLHVLAESIRAFGFNNPVLVDENGVILVGHGRYAAAKLVGRVAKAGRFHSAAAFARHNGSAPLPVWSGNDERHRLSRKGDRQVNVVLHRIAITQLRLDERGRAYYEHRRARGDTKAEALRALKRRISDEVYRRMRHDERLRATPRAALAAAA